MRFAVKFLGCKVSQADAMLARRALLAAGHEEVPQEQAELHVINTCCITGEAEAKSRQSVRRSLQSARQVFVGGCAVNLHADQFAAIDPAVTPFVGTADEVAEAIAGSLGACVDLEHDVLTRESRAIGAIGAIGAMGAAGAGAGPLTGRGAARAASSRSRTAVTATAPTASSRRCAGARARVRPRRCSPRRSAGWRTASPRS